SGGEKRLKGVVVDRIPLNGWEMRGTEKSRQPGGLDDFPASRALPGSLAAQKKIIDVKGGRRRRLGIGTKRSPPDEQLPGSQLDEREITHGRFGSSRHGSGRNARVSFHGGQRDDQARARRPGHDR